MDQLIRCDAFIQNPAASSIVVPRTELSGRPESDRSQPSSRSGGEFKDSAAARKVQKADREKLRRDRLNEQFFELGNILDPGRPKNDKATILVDTIQLLKDLTSEVNKLKTENATLTEESRELAQEKNDLREEKASLKSDIENLNAQYQQRLRATYPWPAMDHSVVIAPPPFPFPVPMQMPPGPFPVHPSLQPYPFIGNHNPGVIANPCSTFVPYITPNSVIEQQSSRNTPPFVHPGNQSRNLSKQDSGSKSSSESKIEKSVDSSEVATDLELKTPGSSTEQE
ncbi:transcription factor bHLH121-like isoform X2 [Momordica charantia]|uniref:Transcription factor bHLH121-like isoform X2 n=1 Tax=Momordica charantia TaxID=3673 RepID=A0A6J1CXG2_MOMCH|nr:transcription factor bHLH121-like isoform X2 [Momordica charantia]